MHGYNFTERVRKVLAMSREEASRLGHEYVSTEHMLLGLIREGEGVAVAALHGLTVDLDALQKQIERMVKQGRAPDGTGPDLPYTSRAKKTLEFAMSEARDLNHSYVGTEHLLLGLLREEKGIAAQVLTDARVTLDAARSEILRLLGTDAPADSARRQPRLARPKRREWVTDDEDGDAEPLQKDLAEVYQTLRNELGWLYAKWDQFQTLYRDGGDRLALLNATAPLFFRIAQEALWADIRNHIRALSAPPDPNRRSTRSTMSVRDIVDMIDDAELRTDIETLVARAVRATEWAHEGGFHRRIRGELTVALERQARPLDDPSHRAVSDALEAIAAVLNQISWHYRQSTTTFDSGGYPHGAVALLYALHQARSSRDTRRDVADRSDQPPEEGLHPH